MGEEIETKKRYKKKYFGKAKKVKGKEKVEEIDLLVIGEPEEVDANFSKFFTAFTMKLMLNEKLAGKAVRLLFWIVNRVGINRLEFYMDENHICSELNVTRATYYRWKKILEDEGIIIKLATNYYMLNPACVVKGKGHRLIDSFRKKVEEKAKKDNEQRDSGQGETTTPEPETPELFSEKNLEEVK